MLTLSKEYVDELRRGYFDSDGVLKKEFVLTFADGVSQSFFNPNMTSSQLRNFYNHVKTAGDVYEMASKTDADGKTLLGKMYKLEPIVSYNKGRDGTNIPDAFFDFIKLNVDCCRTAKDVTGGFIPHFEAVVGYFKYHEKSKGGGRR